MSVYDFPAMTAFWVVLAVALGASMGSFLNCAAWRIAHGESFLKGRSHCPDCGHELGPIDLVPILSWLWLRGRCRTCKKRIPVRYLLTELLFALLTVTCLLRFDLTVLCLRNWIFICCLFCLSLVDLENMTIPDGCLIIAAVAYFAALPFLWTTWQDLVIHVATGLVLGLAVLGISLLMDRVLKKESMGGGDIKLLAVVGLYLGPIPALFALLLSCVIGLLFFGLLRARKKGQGQFPFGPSIAAAAAVMLLFGDGLVSWYVNLML